jgi:hypothetical protein
MTTTMTTTTGDNNDDGDGATGDEVDDFGDGTMGDDNDDATARRVSSRRNMTTITMTTGDDRKRQRR